MYFVWIATFRNARRERISVRISFTVQSEDVAVARVLALEYVEEHLRQELPLNWRTIRSRVEEHRRLR